MSTYYLAWIQSLSTRDMAVERLAIMAVAVVLAWVLADRQEPWIRQLYYLGGLFLYAMTVAVAFWS